MDSSKNRGDFKFRYRPLLDTDDWDLMTYAKNHPFLDEREALAQPARSYWMPFVKASLGKLTKEELEQAAWGAVFALLRQVDYICTSFGLDRSRLGMWAATVPLEAIPVERVQQLPPHSSGFPHSQRDEVSGESGSLFIVCDNEQSTINNQQGDGGGFPPHLRGDVTLPSPSEEIEVFDDSWLNNLQK